MTRQYGSALFSLSLALGCANAHRPAEIPSEEPPLEEAAPLEETPGIEEDGSFETGYWLVSGEVQGGTPRALLHFENEHVTFDRGDWSTYSRSGSLQIAGPVDAGWETCGLYGARDWAYAEGRLWLDFGCRDETREAAFVVGPQGEGGRLLSLDAVEGEEAPGGVSEWTPRDGPWFLTHCESDACWPLSDEETVFAEAAPQR